MLSRRGLLEAAPVDGLDAVQAEAAQAGMGFWQEQPQQR
jgi:hypothetical protein